MRGATTFSTRLLRRTLLGWSLSWIIWISSSYQKNCECHDEFERIEKKNMILVRQ